MVNENLAKTIHKEISEIEVLKNKILELRERKTPELGIASEEFFRNYQEELCKAFVNLENQFLSLFVKYIEKAPDLLDEQDRWDKVKEDFVIAKIIFDKYKSESISGYHVFDETRSSNWEDKLNYIEYYLTKSTFEEYKHTRKIGEEKARQFLESLAK